MIDKNLVCAHFSRAAQGYHFHSPVQKITAGDVLEKLGNRYKGRSDPRKALDIGCGTGTLTEGVLRLFPQVSVTGIDIAEGMIREYAKRFHSANIQGIVTDAEDWAGEGGYDLIVSNAALQWFDDPLAVIMRYSKMLRPGGMMAVSFFGANTFIELVDSFHDAAMARGMPFIDPRSMALITRRDLEDIADAVCKKSAVDAVERSVCYPSVSDFLDTLRSLGTTSADPAHIRGNISIVRDAVRILADKAAPDGSIAVTYDCLNFSAWDMEGR